MSLFDQLKLDQKLSPALIQRFLQEYGDKFLKALDFLQKEGTKIKKNCFSPSNLVIWSIKGLNAEYLIYPDLYCQCQSFLMSSVYRKKEFGFCKHLLAQKMAEALNRYDIVKMDDIEYSRWVNQNYARHNSTNTTM